MPFDGNRLTVVCSVYHQNSGEDPFLVPLSFTRVLNNNEQHFFRRLKVRQEWSPIEQGWIDHPSYIIIENPLPPSEEPVIELGYDTGVEVISLDTIRAGEFLPSFPVNFKNLRVRCIGIEEIRAGIYLFPG